MKELIEHLRQLHQKKINSLQNAMLSIINASMPENRVRLVWSTLTEKVDFHPDGLDLYSPPNLKGESGNLHSFKDFLKSEAEMNLNISRLVRVHGLGQTRFTQELHSHLVVRVRGKAIVVLTPLDHSNFRQSQSQCCILQMFLKHREEDCSQITEAAKKRLIVIASGWSNLTCDEKKNASKCLMKLMEITRVQLIVTTDSSDDLPLTPATIRLDSRRNPIGSNRIPMGIRSDGCWGISDRRESFEFDISQCPQPVKKKLQSIHEKKIKRREKQADSSTDVFYQPQSFTQKYLLQKFENVPAFAEYIKSSDRSGFVLSCPPGMGKSTNMERIRKALEIKLWDFRIILINFSRLCRELMGFKKAKEPVDVFDILAMVTDPPVKKDEGRLIFLLDSYDEICPGFRKLTIKLLERLKELRIKTLVATRPQEETVVAEALGVDKNSIFELDLIDEKDHPKFITGVWKDESKIARAKELLQNESVKKSNVVWGNPVNLHMLAKLFTDENVNTEFIERRDFYGPVIRQGIQDTISTWNASNPNRRDGQDEEDFSEGYDRVQELAVEIILRGKIITASDNDMQKHVSRYPFFDVMNETTEMRFVHITYAEYLVAVQVVRKLSDDKSQKCFINEDDCRGIFSWITCSTIREFVDLILSYTRIESQVAKKVFSETVVYCCIEEERLNVFKMFHDNKAFDDSFFNKRITYYCTNHYPLEILLKTRWRRKSDDLFANYLLDNGARLEKFFDKSSCSNLLSDVIVSHLNALVMRNWENLFVRYIDDRDLKFLHRVALIAENYLIAQFLLEKGAKLEEEDGFESPLWTAINRKAPKEILVLMLMSEYKVTPNEFCEAAEAENTVYLELLLPKVDSVNFTTSCGTTALMAAAGMNRTGNVEFLLGKGADPYKKDKKGRSCFYYAAEVNADECFDFLLAHFNFKQEILDEVLMSAAESDQKEMFQELLAKGADLKAVDFNGNTCLHIIASKHYSCYSEFLEFLLEDYLDKIDIDARNKKGQTPLLMVNRFMFAKMLLERGADPAARDNEGRTALHGAAAQCDYTLCRIIIDSLGDKINEEINRKSNDGETPLTLAMFGSSDRKYEGARVFKLLVANGADLSLEARLFQIRLPLVYGNY